MGRPSRYDTAAPFVTAAGATPVAGHRARSVDTPAGVVEHVVRAWDRVDLLALHYYDDSSLWWRILDANPELLCATDLGDPAWIGRTLRIPRAKGPP